MKKKSVVTTLLSSSLLLSGLMVSGLKTTPVKAEGESFVTSTKNATEAVAPIAHYEFKDSANPGKDSMGNYDLTTVGTVTAADGVATFAGNGSLKSDSLMAAFKNKNVTIKATLSITKPLDLNTGTYAISAWHDCWADGYGFGINNWGGKLRASFHDGTNCFGASRAWSLEMADDSSIEHTIMLSIELGGKVTAYCDDICKGSVDCLGSFDPTGGQTFSLGATTWGGTNYFGMSGTLKDVYVWTASLSEIKTTYDSMVGFNAIQNQVDGHATNKEGWSFEAINITEFTREGQGARLADANGKLPSYSTYASEGSWSDANISFRTFNFWTNSGQYDSDGAHYYQQFPDGWKMTSNAHPETVNAWPSGKCSNDVTYLKIWGDGKIHPGSGAGHAMYFELPRDGSIYIKDTIQVADKVSDGIDLVIYHIPAAEVHTDTWNSNPDHCLYGATPIYPSPKVNPSADWTTGWKHIPSGDPHTYVTPNYDIKKGDYIVFVYGSGPSLACDMTKTAPKIVYGNNPSEALIEDFATNCKSPECALKFTYDDDGAGNYSNFANMSILTKVDYTYPSAEGLEYNAGIVVVKYTTDDDVAFMDAHTLPTGKKLIGTNDGKKSSYIYQLNIGDIASHYQTNYAFMPYIEVFGSYYYGIRTESIHSLADTYAAGSDLLASNLAKTLNCTYLS